MSYAKASAKDEVTLTIKRDQAAHMPRGNQAARASTLVIEQIAVAGNDRIGVGFAS